MSLIRNAAKMAKRSFSASAAAAAGGTPGRKVAVLGAAGGIGQPLGLLMKLNPLVSDLALYDIAGTPGVAADVSHVCTRATTKGYAGADQLGEALSGCDLVLIPAGVPRKPGMTRQDLFNINAGIVKGLTEAIAKHCPQAVIGMISNPVNSTVPIAAEVLRRAGAYDPKKLMGVTTLDVVRAKTFYAEAKGLDASEVDVPVIGGHAGITIIPLFSQAKPYMELTPEERDRLTLRTQDGGTEVVQAKAGKGSATLSMAYAAAVFGDKVLKGLNGEKTFEYSYVQSQLTEVPFFASKVSLGPSGVEEVHAIGAVSAYEEDLIKKSLPELQASIDAGYKFVAEN